MSTRSAQEIFETAKSDFFQSLSPEERAQLGSCPSTVEDVVTSIGRQVRQFVSSRSTRNGSLVCSRVKRFGDALKPYFEIIQIYVQANPEYSALVWGSLRLVFQLATNFATFVDKLSQALERLGAVLSFNKDVVDAVSKLPASSSTQRIQASLGKIYSAMLQFFQAVIRIFRKQDGSSRSKAVLVGKLMWKPFDERFQEIMDSVKRHSTYIKDDLLFLAVQTGEVVRQKDDTAGCCSHDSHGSHEDMQANSSAILKQLRDAAFDRVLRWINPPEFNSELIEARDSMESGTTNWIYDNAAFQEWMHAKAIVSLQPAGRPVQEFGANTLWINGNPGAGKTVLAASIITELQNQASDCKPYYFLFQSSSEYKTQTIAALRALAAQLLQSRRTEQDVLDRFLFQMEENSGGQLTSTVDDLMDVLRMCLEEQSHALLVIDAIDECQDNTTLLRHLLTLSTVKSTKLLLFSRPNVHCLMMASNKQLRLGDNKPSLSADIRVYISRILTELVENGEIIAEQDDLPGIVERLVIGADGMFLWARLMMNFLASPLLNPHSRMQTILNVSLPEGLEEMYERILRAIWRGVTTQRLLARRIFTWLTYAVDFLGTQQLQDAVLVEEAKESQLSQASNYTDFLKTALIACGGLVEQRCLDPHKPERTAISFIHISSLCHGPEVNQSTDPAAQGRSVNRDVDRLQLSENFHLASYATHHWARHLALSTKSLSAKPGVESGFVDFLKALSTFLSKPIVVTAWVQLFYIFGDSSQLTLPFEALLQWVQNAKLKKLSISGVIDLPNLCSDVIEFADDLRTIQKEWAENLQESPTLIWNEVTAFTRSRFLLETQTTKAIPVASDTPAGPRRSTKCLCSASSMSPCGSFMAIISVWPSRLFESAWAYLAVHSTAQQLRRICVDWVIRYEAWTIDAEPKRITGLEIPLDAEEIWLLMRQSLIRDSTGWRVTFPISLHGDGRLFTALRTLYRVEIPASNSSDITYSSFLIDTSFSPQSRQAWCESRALPDLRGCLPIYTYAFVFAADGRLFFSDYEPAKCNHFAIFNPVTDGQLGARLARYAVGNGTQPPITKVAFHPFHPLIILSNDSIQVWDYERNYTSMLEVPNFSVKAISVSTCGGFVVLSGDSQTKVVSLKDIINSSSSPDKMSMPEPDMTAQQPPTSSQSLLPFNMHPGQVMKSSASSPNGVSLVQTSRSIVLMQKCETGEGRSVSIVSLPRQRGMLQGPVDLKLPSASDPVYNIVLNTAGQPWYRFEEAGDGLCPLLVRRDVQAVDWHGSAERDKGDGKRLEGWPQTGGYWSQKTLCKDYK